ncbi:MAG: 50S ribosomal protein L32 [Saprospiraceae bacterium]|nr:50S ribosomal protein L32 [Saprospiraceae bacterium]
MPNPKWRHSKQRKRKRRTHYKAETPQLATCKTTGVTHIMHHAFWHEGSMYYKGNVVIRGAAAEATAEQA